MEYLHRNQTQLALNILIFIFLNGVVFVLLIVVDHNTNFLYCLCFSLVSNDVENSMLNNRVLNNITILKRVNYRCGREVTLLPLIQWARAHFPS